MKRLSIFFLLFFLLLLRKGLIMDVRARQPQLDSLYNLLSKSQDKDSEQLKLLLSIAEAQELSNQTKGIVATNKAIELAQNLGKQQELAIAYNLKARLLLMKQLPVKASEAVQQSIAINRVLNNKYQLAENTLTLAQFVVCGQKSDTTINYINRSLQLFTNSDNNLAMGKIYLFYSNYYAWFNPDTARILLEKTKLYFEKTQRKDWLAYTEFCIATNFTSLNNNAMALEYFDKAALLNLTVKSDYIIENIYCTRGYLYSSLADHSKAQDNFIKGLKVAESIGDEVMQAALLNNIGSTFGEMGNLEKARVYIDKQIVLAKRLNDKSILSLGYQNIGNIYFEQERYRDALLQVEHSLKLALEAKHPDHVAESYGLLGKIYEKLGMFSEAYRHLQLALVSNKKQANFYNICDNLLTLSLAINNSGNVKLIDETGVSLQGNEKTGKAISFASEALMIADSLDLMSMKRDALKLLSEFYKEKKDDKKSFYYFKKYITVKDAIMTSENLKTINNLQLEYETEKKEKEIALLNKEKEIKRNEIDRKTTERNGFSAGFVLFLLIGGVTYNRYRVKQKANERLSTTLAQLKDAQQQLIEQEKLASMGQLTAGIAHEIQNPLNFIINFSQLSNDLFKDLEFVSNENEYHEIISDLEDNLNKIERHGLRADGIIKSMLMHARHTVAEKELTDINELFTISFNLAWQATLLKHEHFKCDRLITLDKTLPRIHVAPQDISRVFINLLNNAFYAMHEKSLTTNTDYIPILEVRSKFSNKQITITIKDNGCGISDEIKGKIFQPFFTTKPTHLGTGLGLSISYDIINAHDGTLSLESSSDNGTTFMIALPA